jgi:hypothetical protein
MQEQNPGLKFLMFCVAVKLRGFQVHSSLRASPPVLISMWPCTGKILDEVLQHSNPGNSVEDCCDPGKNATAFISLEKL